MSWIGRFWESTVGKKTVMAVTGIGLVAFVFLHMAGNLQMFLGADVMNHYAALLKTSMELLWVARLGLITMVVLHVVAAYQLTMLNRRARPQDYAKREPQVSTLASRTLRVGGVVLAVFIVFHLLHFTVGWSAISPWFSKHGVYGNVILGFRTWWVALFYIVAMSALGLHLYHGAWAGLRTLGLAKPSPTPIQRRFALALAVIIWAGFTVIPVAVLLGILS